MLIRHARKVGGVIHEWYRRARSRHELAMLGPAERLDLGYRFDLNAEMQKSFWQS